MKHSFLITLLLFSLIFPTNAEKSTPQPANLTMTLAYVADETGPNKYIFLINSTMAFKTVDGMKKFLSQMPKNSKLTWAPGCLRRGNEPLLESKKEMDAFIQFCKSSGIQFILIPSG